MIRSEDYSPYANDPQPHDNRSGPCKCGAWHRPEEFEAPKSTDFLKTGKVLEFKREKTNS